jgi:CRISPR-associated endonuclease/helicase Cas3
LDSKKFKIKTWISKHKLTTKVAYIKKQKDLWDRQQQNHEMEKMKANFDEFRLEEIFVHLCGGKPYKHQLAAAERILAGESVVVRAPCGSGKTEACFIPFLLAEKKDFPNRLVYSLPTRALVEDITERLRKKMRNLGSFLSVSCQHGANPEDPFFKEDVIVATIDQTIGAYCCTPLSLPAYLGNIPAGAVTTAFLCFDEVHTYDHRLGLQSMLALIEQGHERLGLPFVVMSATLPNSFIEWFRDRDVAVIEGKDEYVPSRKNRGVHLHWISKFLSAENVLNVVSDSVRVMVVCNTVFKAQEIYQKIVDKLSQKGIPVFILHSRFLPQDRSEIENKMKAAFRSGKCGCLVTTQVCEVGLDVSCDVMLTEVAPPDSLIQRIGRCARRGGEGQVYIYEVEFSAPYEKELLEKTKQYVAEHLDGKTLGWKEELEFVNALLDDRFRNIMWDKRRRLAILKTLGDAAFKGDKWQIEKNIRQILNANVTIHENPESLRNDEILRMPWISVNINVLKNQLSKLNAQYWRIKFSDDERGNFTFEAERKGIVWPYEYYAVSPEFISYSPKIGLIFGEKGESLKPSLRIDGHRVKERKYLEESWLEHAEKCLTKFEELINREIIAFTLFNRILPFDSPKIAQGLIALCVALHDLGKLNEEWQRKIDATDVPLAHAPILRGRPPLPPHATISGYALLDILIELTQSKRLGCSLALAIAHHHHTRAIDVIKYRLQHMKAVEVILRHLEKKYEIPIEIKDIKERNESKTQLPTRMVSIERTKSYTIYTIVSRFIRLSDRASLEE